MSKERAKARAAREAEAQSLLDDLGLREREGGVSLDSVFYPVLLVAFGYLAIARR